MGICIEIYLQTKMGFEEVSRKISQCLSIEPKCFTIQKRHSVETRYAYVSQSYWAHLCENEAKHYGEPEYPDEYDLIDFRIYDYYVTVFGLDVDELGPRWITQEYGAWDIFHSLKSVDFTKVTLVYEGSEILAEVPTAQMDTEVLKNERKHSFTEVQKRIKNFTTSQKGEVNIDTTLAEFGKYDEEVAKYLSKVEGMVVNAIPGDFYDQVRCIRIRCIRLLGKEFASVTLRQPFLESVVSNAESAAKYSRLVIVDGRAVNLERAVAEMAIFRLSERKSESEFEAIKSVRIIGRTYDIGYEY